MLAQRLGIPLIQHGAIQPDYALRRPPIARQRAHQHSLARAIRADDAQRLATVQAKADVMDQRLLPARRGDHKLADLERLHWRR